jgi:hypothetical protein
MAPGCVAPIENGAAMGDIAFTPAIVEAAPCAEVPIAPARR